MTAIDTRARITPEHQAKLDALADALTETVAQRILTDPAFFDRVFERLHHEVGRGRHARAMRVRASLLHLLQTFEELEGLPKTAARRDAA